ncbi:hypothetical protein BVY00_01995, partial [bacterium G20]
GKEIRMFDVDRGRDGDINYAVVCDGRTHFVCRRSLHVPHRMYMENTHCDGKACKESSSEVLDISQLSSESQSHLELWSRVPQGMVLVTQDVREYGRATARCYSSGDRVVPKQLDSGVLLADGEGTTFVRHEYGFVFSEYDVIHYVRNQNGKAVEHLVGREGRKRTEKKLTKLRRSEHRSEVSFEVTYLNELMRELMQLHRTPEVQAEIENVKELLRLASSLSVEASIEAAEGNEQIARELASSRAREIGAGLEQIRERLMLEQKVREEVRKELNDRYDN